VGDGLKRVLQNVLVMVFVLSFGRIAGWGRLLLWIGLGGCMIYRFIKTCRWV